MPTFQTSEIIAKATEVVTIPPYYLGSIQAEIKANAELQEWLNEQPKTKAILELAAETQMIEYSQYCGYWNGDEWQVVTARHKYETKMGVAWEPGDVLLAKNERCTVVPSIRTTVWSFRNGCSTGTDQRFPELK